MAGELWSGVPGDVLAEVMARLALPDQVRTSAVCTAWRLVAMDATRRPPPLPALWVALPDGENLSFASFSEDMRRYVLPRKLMSFYNDMDCIGSSEGWLMVADRRLCELNAVNPITGGRIALLRNSVPSYKKAIVVPRCGRQLFGAAVLRRGDTIHDLKLIRASATEETAAHDEEGFSFSGFFIEDIAAHDGKLYALESENRVMVFDLNVHPSCPGWVIPAKLDRRPYHRKHLGLISGDLVMLLWRHCRPCPFRVRRCVPEFQAFRLERDQRGPDPKDEWVEMNDLGRHAIVLGPHGFTALSTRDFPELRRNCVYSIVHGAGDDGSVLEVVNLRTGAVGVEPLCDEKAAPFWFQPRVSGEEGLH